MLRRPPRRSGLVWLGRLLEETVQKSVMCDSLGFLEWLFDFAREEEAGWDQVLFLMSPNEPKCN